MISITLPGQLEFKVNRGIIDGLKITLSDGSMLWKPAGEKVIRRSEMEEFLSDTERLIWAVAMRVFSPVHWDQEAPPMIIEDGEIKSLVPEAFIPAELVKFIPKDPQIEEAINKAQADPIGVFFSPEAEYWHKWGPLVLGMREDQGKESFDTSSLAYVCMAGALWVSIWRATFPHRPGMPAPIGLVEKIYLEKIQGQSKPPKYWSMRLDRRSGSVSWEPAKSNLTVFNAGIPWVILRHPPSKLTSREAVGEWVRESILENMAAYISQQKIAFYPVVGKKGSISLKGQINNRFLAWLLHVVSQREGESDFCGCGCGEYAPPGRKYLNPQHEQRARDMKRPEREKEVRRIKASLRTRKNRKQITPEEYSRKCKRVDKLSRSGLSDKEIRGRLGLNTTKGKRN